MRKIGSMLKSFYFTYVNDIGYIKHDVISSKHMTGAVRKLYQNHNVENVKQVIELKG